MNVAQLLAWIKPGMLPEQAVACAVDLQRLSLPSASVQGEHELPAQPLPERVLGHEAGQFRDQLPCLMRRQVRVDAILDRREPQLLEPRLLDLPQGLGHVGQGRPAPQGQCLVQHAGRFRIPALGHSRARLAGLVLELHEIENVMRPQMERVPRSLADQRSGETRDLAQFVDISLNLGMGGLGRIITPQEPLEPTRRDPRPAGK
jgi:hypothetical protein